MCTHNENIKKLMITIACIVFRDQKTNFTDSVSGEHCARSSPLLLIEDPCGFPL